MGSAKVQRIYDRVAKRKLDLKESKWRPVKEFKCENGTYGESQEAKLKEKLKNELSKHQDNLMNSLLHPSVKTLVNQKSGSVKQGSSKPNFKFDISSEDSYSSSDDDDLLKSEASTPQIPPTLSKAERLAAEADQARRDSIYDKLISTSSPAAKAPLPQQSVVKQKRVPLAPLQQKAIQSDLSSASNVQSFTSAAELVRSEKHKPKNPKNALPHDSANLKSKFFRDKRTEIKARSVEKAHKGSLENEVKKTPNSNREWSRTNSKRKPQSRRKKPTSKPHGKKAGKGAVQNPIAMLKAVPLQWEIEEQSLQNKDLATPRPRDLSRYLKDSKRTSTARHGQETQATPRRARKGQTTVETFAGDVEVVKAKTSRQRSSSRHTGGLRSKERMKSQQRIDNMLPLNSRELTPARSAHKGKVDEGSNDSTRGGIENPSTESVKPVTRISQKPKKSDARQQSKPSISPSTYSCGGFVRHQASRLRTADQNSFSAPHSTIHSVETQLQGHSQNLQNLASSNNENRLARNLEKQFEFVSSNKVYEAEDAGAARIPPLTKLQTGVTSAGSRHPENVEPSMEAIETPRCTSQKLPPEPRRSPAPLFTPKADSRNESKHKPSPIPEKPLNLRKGRWGDNLYLQLQTIQEGLGGFLPLEHILLGVHELDVPDLNSLYFEQK